MHYDLRPVRIEVRELDSNNNNNSDYYHYDRQHHHHHHHHRPHYKKKEDSRNKTIQYYRVHSSSVSPPRTDFPIWPTVKPNKSFVHKNDHDYNNNNTNNIYNGIISSSNSNSPSIERDYHVVDQHVGHSRPTSSMSPTSPTPQPPQSHSQSPSSTSSSSVCIQPLMPVFQSDPLNLTIQNQVVPIMIPLPVKLLKNKPPREYHKPVVNANTTVVSYRQVSVFVLTCTYTNNYFMQTNHIQNKARKLIYNDFVTFLYRLLETIIE